MALVDLLKTSDNLDRLNDLRTHLAAVQAKALGDCEEARESWSRAAFGELEGSGNSSATAKAEEALTKAKRALDKAVGALVVVDARIEQVKRASSQADTEARWEKAERLVDARAKKAAMLARSAEDFAMNWKALMQLNAELNAALPVKPPDPDAAMLWASHLEDGIRKELVRLGVGWASSWPWGITNLPVFLPRVEDAAKVVRTWRESHRG